MKHSGFVARLPLLITLAGVALILLWLAIRSYAILRPIVSLLEHQARAEAIVEKGILATDPDEAEALVFGVQNDIADLIFEAGILIDAAPSFSWIPKIGPVLAAAPELMTMAEEGIQAAAYTVAGLKPALSLLQAEDVETGGRIPELLEIIDNSEANLAQASLAVDRLAIARSQIDNVDRLPWRIQSLLVRLDDELPMIEDGLRTLQILPELMGSDGQRAYLLMAQNEDELRATGGFISGAGVLTVENGQVLSVDFADASVVDDYLHKPYDFPPRPYYEFMGIELFLFRDANFWPDFPVSAENAMNLYNYGQGVPLDGVIAVDQRFVRMLLGAVGPVTVPELEKEISAENVVGEIRTAWGPQEGEDRYWINDRKSFMGPLANALRLKVESDLGALDPIGLARTMQAAVEQRHLQIYMRDPDEAILLAKAGWDGRQLNQVGQDFLLVVDTSMGFNKVGAVVERELIYDVSLAENDDSSAHLTIQYEHTAPESSDVCVHGTTYTGETRYVDLINDCYWNYLRVYAPLGSELLDSSRHLVPADALLTGTKWEGIARVVTDEPGQLTIFDNFLLLPQSQSAESHFDYRLAPSVLSREGEDKVYRLMVNKQAGTDGDPLVVRITLPPGTNFVSSSPQPTNVDGQTVTFKAKLNTDQLFTVAFR